MVERAPRTAWAATQIGLVAARALTEGAQGAVRAVFERSAYIAFGDAWVCIGLPALGDGPLNVLCASRASRPPLIPAQAGIQTPPLGVDSGSPLSRGRAETGIDHPESALCAPAPARPLGGLVRAGDPVRVAQGTVQVGEALAVSLGAAAVWRPDPPRPWTARALAEGVTALQEALPPVLPAEGLAALLREREKASPLVEAARPADAHLSRLVAAAAGEAPERAEAERLVPLLGLGPGLTPSGDDFLGGALVALSCLELRELGAALWSALEPHASERTNDISRAHLRAAAEGFGSAALHALIDATLSGGAAAIPARLRAAAAIGHTSGWDAIAGASVVLRAAAACAASSRGKIDSAART